MNAATISTVSPTGAMAQAWARPLQHLSRFDQRALLGLRRWRAPWATTVMRGLTHSGDAGSWLLVGVLLACRGRRGRRQARRLAVATGIAAGVAQLLKHAISRPRPSDKLEGFVALAENPDAFSFPSGHAAAAFAAATALGGNGSAVGPVMALHALGISLSRVYLGAHYPVDVAAGALLGIGAGLTARAALDA